MIAALTDALIVTICIVISMFITKKYFGLAGTEIQSRIHFIFLFLIVSLICILSLFFLVWLKEDIRVGEGLWLGHSIRWLLPSWVILISLPIILYRVSRLLRDLNLVWFADLLYEGRYISMLFFSSLVILWRLLLKIKRQVTSSRNATREENIHNGEYWL
jgi:hypothetical protein